MMEPQIGDIWLNEEGDYSLITDIYTVSQAGDIKGSRYVSIYCITNGETYGTHLIRELDGTGYFVQRVA